MLNKAGLHARPAMQLVDVANGFASDITVFRAAADGEPAVEADAKSVLQVIILAAPQGTSLRVDATGDDAQAAVDQIAGLFEGKFGEEE